MEIKEVNVNRLVLALGLALFYQGFGSNVVLAQSPSVIAEICSEAGVCAPMDPATALVVFGLAQIAKELSKDDPFGKNNEIVKAITTIVNDIKRGGPGP